ncbi:MAG: redoxin family protein [Phycisphaerae bacterium]
MNANRFALCCLTLALAAASASADPTLKIGDAAPPLHITQWIKGGPIDVHADKDAVYVVEFWATWCGPCKLSIPHLTEIQQHFAKKKVFVIGISSESEETVRNFLKSWDKKMDYAVAVERGGASRDYMVAAGIRGIPHAFIVKSGKVVWNGHPMEIDETLAQITGDVAWRQQIQQERKRVSARQKAYAEFNAAMQAQQWDNALRALDALETLDAGNPRIAMQKFALLAIYKNDPAGATAAGTRLAAQLDDWQTLTAYARDVLVGPMFDGKRNVAVATAMAEKAVKLSARKEPMALETLARARFAAHDAPGAHKLLDEAQKLDAPNEVKELLKHTREELAPKPTAASK